MNFQKVLVIALIACVFSQIALAKIVGIKHHHNKQKATYNHDLPDRFGRGGSRRQVEDRPIVRKSQHVDDCRNYREKGLTPIEKKEILDKHNQIRKFVATGKMKDFPTASDMIKLKWDYDLQVSAQSWANKCQTKQSPYGISGQKGEIIMGFEFPAGTTNPQMDISGALEKLKHQVDLYQFDKDSILTYDSSKHLKTSHFAQIIWAKTSQIGCGVAEYAESVQTQMLIVCHYSPQGLNNGEPIYLKGQACSRCQCDLPMFGLCENK